MREQRISSFALCKTPSKWGSLITVAVERSHAYFIAPTLYSNLLKIYNGFVFFYLLLNGM